jgi:hypothetical protein
VKFHEGILYSDGKDLDNLGFYLEVKHSLNNKTAVNSDHYSYWKDSPIPPLSLFQLTDKKS